MRRFAPALPLIGGGATKFAPVFVGDVAEAVARLVDRGEADGKTYELGGPEVLTFKQLMQFTLNTIERKRLLIPVPWSVARLQAPDPGPAAQAAAHGRPGRASEVRQCGERGRRSARSARWMDWASRPQGIEGIVPGYLYRFRKAGQFTAPKGMPE